MDNNMNLVVSCNLKLARVRNNWSQAFVSSLTGLSIRSISRAETGCSVSKSTLKRLCVCYHIDASSLYEPTKEQRKVQVDLIPEAVAIGLLRRNDFIGDLQRETILRFSHLIRKETLMNREDVEAILPDVINKKKTYTLADVVSCCLAVNQQTINNITDIAMA